MKHVTAVVVCVLFLGAPLAQETNPCSATIESACVDTPGCVWQEFGHRCLLRCAALPSEDTCVNRGGCIWNATEAKCTAPCATKGVVDCRSTYECQYNRTTGNCETNVCAQTTSEADCGLLHCHWSHVKPSNTMLSQCQPSFCYGLDPHICLFHDECWIEASGHCSTNSCAEIFNATACNMNPYGCEWKIDEGCVSNCQSGFFSDGCKLSPKCFYNATGGACEPSNCMRHFTAASCRKRSECLWYQGPGQLAAARCLPFSCELLFVEQDCDVVADCAWNAERQRCGFHH